jgi:hypothetical protein
VTPLMDPGAETPMQVSISGAADLHSLVMLVVDASSSPANFQGPSRCLAPIHDWQEVLACKHTPVRIAG